MFNFAENVTKFPVNFFEEINLGEPIMRWAFFSIRWELPLKSCLKGDFQVPILSTWGEASGVKVSFAYFLHYRFNRTDGFM